MGRRKIALLLGIGTALGLLSGCGDTMVEPQIVRPAVLTPTPAAERSTSPAPNAPGGELSTAPPCDATATTAPAEVATPCVPSLDTPQMQPSQ